jgi:hypothetical protein
MTNQTRDLGVFAAAAFAMLMWACDGGSPSSPTKPSAAVPTAPPVSQSSTISGFVSEAMPSGAIAPVEGVLVEETNSHQTVSTDAKGTFSIAGVSGPLVLSLTKPGYFATTNRFPAGANYMTLRIFAIPAAYTLSGLVSELTPDGRRPLEGVLVEGNKCGGGVGNCQVQDSTTGPDGLYSMSLYAGENGVWVTKEGYQVDGMPPKPSCDNCIATVTLNGDTRLDIQLVRR